MADLSSRVLDARFYRALPVDAPGYEPIELILSLPHTALIGMHCWNIGCPDGPAVDVGYCVGMGWPDATREAGRIISDVIRPAMDAARGAGLAVYHVEADWMDAHYPDIPSRRRVAPKPSVRTDEQQRLLDRAHGSNYMENSPLARMKRAERVSPQADEPLLFYTDTLDAHLKAHHITTLIYTGFATDMCVLNAEGGARAMLARGYRCILMRDGTVGVETPESFPERLATRYGIHLFEWQLGYSTLFEAFQRALTPDMETGKHTRL